jgi:transposase
MNQFPSADDLASWAGVCPGNNETGGKRLSGKTRKGSRWLRQKLCQSAWCASRCKNSYFAAFFQRIAAHRGRKRAIVAVSHSLLVACYYMLKRKCHFQDLGQLLRSAQSRKAHPLFRQTANPAWPQSRPRILFGRGLNLFQENPFQES